MGLMREKGRESGSCEEGGKGNSKTKINNHPETNGYRNKVENTTTFFITNFPDTITAEDMWEAFARYWRVGEVFIPAKRDKFGKRFGFARFADVSDAQTLLKKIEDTWFGTFKIRANLSKFKRDEDNPKLNKYKQQIEQQLRGGVNKREGTIQGVSFKDVLDKEGAREQQKNALQKSSVSEHKRRQQYLQQRDDLSGVLKVDVVPANVEKLKNSYVGTLWEVKEAESIQMQILMEGFQDVQATMMGIDKILLSSIKEGGVQRAFEANKLWWEKKFSDIKVWSSIQKPRGRRIWVRIFGAPPHAWGWECFNRIVWRIGNLINLDGPTTRQERLDVARAQIAVTSWKFVDEIQEIKVNEELFVVRVMEERFGEVDLGVTRKTNDQCFSEGSTTEDYLSEVERCDGEEGVENCAEEEEVANCDGEGGVEICDGEGGEEIGEVVGDDSAVGRKEEALVEVPGERIETVQYPVVNNRVLVSDTNQKGTEAEKVITMVERNREVGAVESVRVVEGTDVGGCDDVLILTSLSDEGVGRNSEDRERVEQVAASVEEETRVTDCDSGGEDNCVDVGVDLGIGLSSQCVLGPISCKNKNKCVVVDEREVGMKYRILKKGACSYKAIGLGGPNISTGSEDQFVNVLINKEVALLQYESEKELAHEKGENCHTHRPVLLKTKSRGVDAGAALAANVLYGGLTKSKKFAKGSQHGKKGRKKKTKPRIENPQFGDDREEDIPDESSQVELVSSNVNNKMVPISALEVMLIEGESNELNNEQYKQHRVQAERLFNIGINMGVTTNSERITMVEKLMDLEENEVDAIEGWEEEEVS
ncbi:hypothetical protein TSUD_115030 [Trifolium subterraneum]|uniref:RRM domain-containing protein n=1 Tax=Trifolium subterraneum TaxID=3900 RepID=A0A2Z6PAZ0_TRISU|nr:hypothetical protein TSUD_115030 [Trifolium subterraneum]